MADGDIGAIIDNFDYDTANGANPSMCHVAGDIYAVAYTGDSYVGYVKTVRIHSNGLIDDVAIDSLRFSDYSGEYPRMLKAHAEIYVILYLSSAQTLKMCTVRIHDDGQIDDAVIDWLRFANNTSTPADIVCVRHTVFAIVQPFNNGGARCLTMRIYDNGAIDRNPPDSLSFEDAEIYQPTIRHVVGHIYAIAYRISGVYGMLKTVRIHDDGHIDDTVIDEYNFEQGVLDWPRIASVSSNIIAIAYMGPGNDGWLKTVKIHDDGQIVKPYIDAFEWNPVQVNPPGILRIPTNIALICAGQGAAYGWLLTVRIHEDGQIDDSIISRETSQTIYATRPDIIELTRGMYAIAYQLSSTVGRISTVPIDLSPLGENSGLLMRGIG